MNIVEEAGAPELADLREMTPEELAFEADAARIVARLTRTDEKSGDGSEAVRVAAFNSFI
ncbi:hypothetical protein E1287_03825 [Actinomadura sp. KC06]|uniref:hypothetical protein n=1 Tax=unclassified Actinomadura TaxID=2626254 RepID=UPI0010530819|nr:hypothetical protein [Actinomadura sp. KC06]TDD39239.1 hypothetical protein E1287_03825 [Actinomadura sp. KC06]